MPPRSDWIKEYRDKSVWPVVNEQNVDSERFSLIPFRSEGCLYLLIGGAFLFGVLFLLGVLLAIFQLVGIVRPC